MAEVQAWRATQAALATEVTRVTTLLRSVNTEKRPEPVLGRWGLADIAMHLSQTWIAIPGLARADLSEVEAIVPGRGAGPSVARDVGQLGAVTLSAVAADPERDLGVLADRIETRSREYLAHCAEADPDLHRPWLLSGITVPPHVFTAHQLSETVVHGADIARAAGRPWRIEPAHAALVVRWFLFELLLYGAPALIADPATLESVRGRYRFDIRGHGSVRMVFDERGARLDVDSGHPDCRMSVDPVAFLLMFFGRRGPVATAARGGLLAWGRKPWLALRLQKALPTP
jgi:uncharacterized protein (TIGR03083 family)